jgi:short-subunit dehydrogenase
MTSGKEKIALITNATSGIGKEIASIHAEKGGGLVLVSKDKNALEKLKNELTENFQVPVYTIAKSLGDSSFPQDVFSEVHKAGIEVDYLVNDIGFGDLCKSYVGQGANFLAIVDIHIIALASLTRLFLPELKKKEEGRILNISSTDVCMPCALEAMYFTSEAFFSHFSTAIASDLVDTNVTVSNLLPMIKKRFFGNKHTEIGNRFTGKRVNSRKIALKGYKGMLAGRMHIQCGTNFSMFANYQNIPIVPKKIVYKSVRKMQEIF